MMLLEVDPNLVRPGWTPLVVILLLGVVLFFLGRSMIKQFGRIDVPSAAEVAGERERGEYGNRGGSHSDRRRAGATDPGSAGPDPRWWTRGSAGSALSRR